MKRHFRRTEIKKDSFVGRSCLFFIDMFFTLNHSDCYSPLKNTIDVNIHYLYYNITENYKEN